MAPLMNGDDELTHHHFNRYYSILSRRGLPSRRPWLLAGFSMKEGVIHTTVGRPWSAKETLILAFRVPRQWEGMPWPHLMRTSAREHILAGAETVPVRRG